MAYICLKGKYNFIYYRGVRIFLKSHLSDSEFESKLNIFTKKLFSLVKYIGRNCYQK